MWYSTRKEAEEACKWKEIEYGESFVVLEDRESPNEYMPSVIYWAQRKSAIK